MTLNPRTLGLSDEDLEALGYALRAAHDAPPPEGDGAESSPGSASGSVSLPAGAWRWSLTVVLLVLSIWGASAARQRPAPIPANTPDTVFSSARAMAQLVDLARAPRPSGSAEHARVRAYLRQRLLELGLAEPPARSDLIGLSAGSDGILDAVPVRNVVARLNGRASTGAVLVTAHYDTRPLVAGAGTDGLGLAVVLETMRALASSPLPRNDVIVVLTDAEKLGGLGGLTFAQHHPWMEDVAYSVSTGIGGAAGSSWIVGSPSDALVPGVATGARARHPLSTSVAGAFEVRGSATSSHAILSENGVPGLELVAQRNGGSVGTVLDVVERVDERTLAHHGVQLHSIVRAASEHDFGTRPTAPTVPLVQTTATGLGLVAYPAAWSGWIAAALGTLWVWLVMLMRWRGVHPARLGVGALLALFTVGGAAFAAQGLMRVLAATHPELGRIDSGVFAPAAHVLALLAFIVGGLVLGFAVARVRFTRSELYLGALSVPLGLLVYLTVTAPLAAVALQIPLAIALAHTLIDHLAFSRRSDGWPAWAIAVLAGGSILLFIVPNAQWAVAELWPTDPLAVGGLLAAGALLLMPLAEWLRAPRAWWTPLVTTGSAVVTVALFLPDVQGSDRHPELSSLALLVDDTGAAVTSGVRDAANDGLRGPMAEPVTRRIDGTWLTVRGTGEAWARSWAVAGETTGRGVEGLLLPRASDWVVAGAGPAAELALPSVEIASVSEGSERTTVALLLRSGLGAEILGVTIPGHVPGVIESVHGMRSAPQGNGPVRALRWWADTHEEALEVEMSFPPGTRRVEIDVIEHHLRPRSLLGSEFFIRDDAVLPDASTGSDRLIQRTSVPLPIELRTRHAAASSARRGS